MRYAGTTLRLTTMLAAVLTATACSNPVSSGTHASPGGVEIVSGSDVVVRVQLTSATEAPTVTGNLAVAAGQQTEPLSVRFLNRQGTVMTVATGYHLRVTPGTPAVARWESTTAGAFSGRVVGVAPGAATIVFELWHGAVGGGHVDPPVIPVPVTVTASN